MAREPYSSFTADTVPGLKHGPHTYSPQVLKEWTGNLDVKVAVGEPQGCRNTKRLWMPPPPPRIVAYASLHIILD